MEIDAKQEEKSKRLWIHFNIGVIKQSPKVAVYLPKKQYDSLALQTSHGDIKLNDFKGNSVKAIVSNGDIKVQNTDAILTLQTNHGDIDLAKVAFHGRNSFTTSSGDIHIQSVSDPENSKKVPQDQLILKSSHGDIDLNGYQGNIVTANTNSGDIHLQNIDASFTVRAEHGDINIQSIENFYVQNQVTTSNGDIMVSVGHDPKSLNVDFKGSEVQSDYPIQIQGATSTSTNEYDNRQLKGVIGTKAADSPTLTMQTHHGNISFSR